MVIKLTSLFKFHGKKYITRTGETVLEVNHKGVLDLLHDSLFVSQVLEKVPLHYI